MNTSHKQAFVNQAQADKEDIPDDDYENEDEDEDELDEDEFPLDFEDEDDDEGDMNEEILSAFLTTEDGDNIATVLEQGFANIQKTITIQNQILVKMLSQLTNK